MQESQITRISELIDWAIERCSNAGGLPWYRGHADAQWTLTPSAHRNHTFFEEQLMNNNFRMMAPTRYQQCPPDGDMPRWITLMRHYGLPTRLLDWTESPLVATFFAVAFEDVESDGAVWALHPSLFNEIEIGVLGFRPLSNPRVRDVLLPPFKKTAQVDEVIAVVSQDVDLRMTLQHSKFTIHGRRDPLENHPRAAEFLAKAVIPREHKPALQDELRMLAIRRAFLFPDLDNLAVQLKNEFVDGKYEHLDYEDQSS